MCLDPTCETKKDWGKPKEMKAKKAGAKLKELTGKQKLKAIVKVRAKKAKAKK